MGMAIGTFNTYVLLTIVYLVMFPFLRLWFLVRREDPLGRRLWEDDAPPGFTPPDGPGAPAAEDLERLF